MIKNIAKGMIGCISGDSADMWISDYDCRVVSPIEVLETPSKYAKKVLVKIDSIDGDTDVYKYVRKTAILPA